MAWMNEFIKKHPIITRTLIGCLWIIAIILFCMFVVVIMDIPALIALEVRINTTHTRVKELAADVEKQVERMEKQTERVGNLHREIDEESTNLGKQAERLGNLGD